MAAPHPAIEKLWHPTDEDERELERPLYPYVPCPHDLCHHPVGEHDENGRCHVPECSCGLNPW